MKHSKKSVKVNYYFPFGKSCGRVEALCVNVAFGPPFSFVLGQTVIAPKAKHSK